MEKPRITPIVMPETHDEPQENQLNSEKRELCKEAAARLEVAFTWEDTVEGEYFWLSVHDRLRAISHGEPLK